MLNHELIFNGSGFFPCPVWNNGAGQLGRRGPSGVTDIVSGCGLGDGRGSGGGGGAASGFGFLEGAVLGGAGGARSGSSGLSESGSCSGSGLGAPS